MSKPTDMGINRTGAGLAPVKSSRTKRGAESGGPSPDGSYPDEHLALGRAYLPDLEPVGTMPPPATVTGAAKAALDWVQGHKGTVLLDKIGERLAFERTGTRLWEGVLRKRDLTGGFAGGPSRADIVQICTDEANHFAMLVETLTELGADPTAVTPSADVTAVESQGLLAVVGDPRTTLEQALHAALIAELADNASWEMLSDLARGLGQDELAARFALAGSTEATHLAKVRNWLRTFTEAEAGAA